MKKILMAGAMSVGIIMFAVPMAFAQTASSTPGIPAGMTIQQEIDYLEKEVQLLVAELEAMNAAQQSLTAQIQSSKQVTASPLLGAAIQSSTSARPFRIMQEAEVNFGSGFVRGADVQVNHPITTPGQIIKGKIVFICAYNSDEVGLPQFCTVPTGATSSFPQIADASLTIKFSENSYICSNNIPTDKVIQNTETITTDGNGNFSFVAPGDATLQQYTASIYIAGQPILVVNPNNATAVSNACAKS